MAGEAETGRVSLKLHDVYRTLNGEASREKDKAVLFLDSNKIEGITTENVEEFTTIPHLPYSDEKS